MENESIEQRIEDSKKLSDSFAKTYDIQPEWMNNAAHVAALLHNEWSIDITPSDVRKILNGETKRIEAKTYSGPAEDITAKSGFRHTFAYSWAEVIHAESHVTGVITLTLRFAGRSA